MTFSGFAPTAAAISSFVGSLGGFHELCPFSPKLCGVVAVADDLRAPLVKELCFWLVGARTALALGASTVTLLGRARS